MFYEQNLLKFFMKRIVMLNWVLLFTYTLIKIMYVIKDLLRVYQIVISTFDTFYLNKTASYF